MKNGYDQFFQNARKAASQGEPVLKPKRMASNSKSRFELSEADIDKQLKLRMGMKPAPTLKKRKRKGIPWKLVTMSCLGIFATAWGVENHSEVERYVKRIEISFLGIASAEETKSKSEEKKSEQKKEDVKKEEASAKAVASPESKHSSAEDQIDHLSKLNDRKKELDEREEELTHMDQELQAQKVELEKRLKELEDVRRGISSVLEEKVKVDDKKVDTLVLMYSDMKPPQAAKVFETMDEDLAVEILGRMKKKSAADIMNLLKPEKAQSLSEKFAGYRRK